jgi:signal transduction histidine kinase
LKHAHATTITLTLLQDDQFITLRFSDNGIGFDTTQKGNGIGIDNIRSRATAYNGTADVVSAPGKGCMLTAVFPFTEMVKKFGE